ncbi:MAG: ATP-binding protein, partial [Geminicoccaceae bacterium]|nr:ATP-binding protein [Geminicoccaceae bacterium]
LDLARAERPTSRPETAVPLGPVLGLVLEDLGRAGLPVERIAIAGDPGTLAARIDPDGFALILRNLLENALRHGDPAAPVALDIEPPGRITIRNGGPPLPPGLLADPPAAAAAGSAGGAGLGLLIARTAARASGSRLELVSPIPGTGGGVEARLDLPG